jgi:2,3-bisphosphoglycerate-dependent phosphoglycerate mutase
MNKNIKLILVRHGISTWNKLGLWTGWKDPELAEEGVEEAKKVGNTLLEYGVKIEAIYTADLKRTMETTEIIKDVLSLNNIATVINPALRERNYGDLAGKNKWEVQKKFGDEQFQKWRRGYNEPIPNGESLKDVFERVVPYYKSKISSDLKSGKNTLIVASGNSLRALVKYLENISDENISKLEIGTGEIILYELSADLRIINKELLIINPKKGKV